MTATRNPLRVTLPLLAILAAALLVILRPAAPEYPDLMRRGARHVEAAERTAAIATYRKAARLQPDDPLPRLRAAHVYLDWGRTDEALREIEQAERLGADDAALLRLRIEAHTALADWDAVAKHAQTLLNLAPDDMDAHHALARACVNRRKWDAARARYRTLLDLAPSDATAHERLGALLLGVDDAAAFQHLFAAETELAEQLLTALTEAQADAPDEPAYADVLLGRALLEGDASALAARHFRRAVERRPDYAIAHAYLGHALDKLGAPDEAEAALERAVALAPDSATAHTLLGLHHEQRGDLAAARAEYETAYDLDPDNPAICVEIGQTWAAEGRYVPADTWLREAVSLQPNDPALWEVLARFYLNHNIKSTGQAVEATEALLKLAPESAVAHDLRGWAALQMDQYATAREHLTRALAIDPTLAAAHYHLGLLHKTEGKPDQAREAFIRARDLDTTGALTPLIERAMDDVAPTRGLD